MKRDMRQKFVVGNWKMHTTTTEAAQLARAVVDGIGIDGVDVRDDDRVSVMICPPFPYIALVGEILKGSNVLLGAQNLYPEKEGAFTGEVSPTMLLISAASSSSSDTASGGTNWANPMRSLTIRCGLPLPPASM